MAFAEDIMRGWNAPLPAILSSAILMLPILALNGPTASGKSSLAVDVAVALTWRGQPA